MLSVFQHLTEAEVFSQTWRAGVFFFRLFHVKSEPTAGLICGTQFIPQNYRICLAV